MKISVISCDKLIGCISSEAVNSRIFRFIIIFISSVEILSIFLPKLKYLSVLFSEKKTLSPSNGGRSMSDLFFRHKLLV